MLKCTVSSSRTLTASASLNLLKPEQYKLGINAICAICNANDSTRMPIRMRLTNKTPIPPGLASKIDDLCGALTQGCKSKYRIGFLEDQFWQHHVYHVPGPGSSDQISDVAPITQVIYGYNSKMTTIDIYPLAFTLASSVLQLYNTPWLPTVWGSNDIFMLRTTAGSILPSQFYVSQTFDSPPPQVAKLKKHRCVKNEMVFALGVALLELSYGQPLLSLKTPDDLNDQVIEDSVTEVSIATRLANRIHEREMENYAKPVLRCVGCNFDTFPCDLNDRSFREKFFNSVVRPLRNDYEYATAKRP